MRRPVASMFSPSFDQFLTYSKAYPISQLVSYTGYRWFLQNIHESTGTHHADQEPYKWKTVSIPPVLLKVLLTKNVLSVVFSSWASSLDMGELGLLDDADFTMQYVRIDGKEAGKYLIAIPQRSKRRRHTSHHILRCLRVSKRSIYLRVSSMWLTSAADWTSQPRHACTYWNLNGTLPWKIRL